jgi:hypothetical protein
MRVPQAILPHPAQHPSGPSSRRCVRVLPGPPTETACLPVHESGTRGSREWAACVCVCVCARVCLRYVGGCVFGLCSRAWVRTPCLAEPCRGLCQLPSRAAYRRAGSGQCGAGLALAFCCGAPHYGVVYLAWITQITLVHTQRGTHSLTDPQRTPQRDTPQSPTKCRER